jgi:hypothetical protein
MPLLVTNARYDAIIHSRAILKIVADAERTPIADNAPRPNVARPGWFTFDVPLEDGTVRRTEVRFPSTPVCSVAFDHALSYYDPRTPPTA